MAIIPLNIDSDMKTKIDSISKVIGKTRNELYREFIKVGFDAFVANLERTEPERMKLVAQISESVVQSKHPNVELVTGVSDEANRT